MALIQNIEPRKDVVLVEGIEIDQSQEFLVAKSEQNIRPDHGKVICLGKDVVGYGAGDIIYYDKFRAVEIMSEGRSYFFIKAEDIYGVIRSH